MTRRKIYLLIVIALVSLQFGGSCGSDKSTQPPPGTDITDTATVAYYGLTSDKVLHAHYFQYVSDSGRQFFIDSLNDDDALGIFLRINQPVVYQSQNATPVEVWKIDTLYDTSQLAVVYLGVKENGLFWHGISLCIGDFPFATPLWIAPFPIDDSLQWQYADLVPGRLDNCSNGLVGGRNLKMRVQGPFSKTVQGQLYDSVYSVQVIYQQDNYEVWLKPSLGIIWATEFLNDSTFTNPNEGFQVRLIE